MMHPEEVTRYSRQLLLPEVGKEGQAKLKAAKVLVIGAGGLGCPALQYLAGAGVGTLGIIDDDIVAESNLHRQILYGSSDIGQYKALAAKARLQDLNPYIEITAYPERLTTQNALTLFENYDIILDGSDNFSTRYLVNDASLLTDTPLVYGAVYKFQGQVAVFNDQGGPSYRCLFPEPPAPGDAPSCSEIGVLGVTPGIIGTLQANEALKMILGIGDILSGKLWLIQGLTLETTTLQITKNQKAIDQVLANRESFASFDYEHFCGINPNVQEITFDQAGQWPDAQYLDVRQPDEQPKIHELHPMTIPLDQLDLQAHTLDKDRPIICFCQSGIRSKKATELLMGLGFTQVYSLKQGASLLQNVI